MVQHCDMIVHNSWKPHASQPLKLKKKHYPVTMLEPVFHSVCGQAWYYFVSVIFIICLFYLCDEHWPIQIVYRPACSPAGPITSTIQSGIQSDRSLGQYTDKHIVQQRVFPWIVIGHVPKRISNIRTNVHFLKKHSYYYLEYMFALAFQWLAFWAVGEEGGRYHININIL